MIKKKNFFFFFFALILPSFDAVPILMKNKKII